MNGVNLLPWREERIRSQHKRIKAVGGVLLVLIFALHSGQHWQVLKQKKLQISRNAALVAGVKEHDNAILNQGQGKIDYLELHDWLAEINRLWYQRRQVVNVLFELMVLQPKNMVYDRVSRGPEGVVLMGRASEDEGISEIIRSLNQSNAFSNVSINVIEMESQKANGLTAFTLSLTEAESGALRSLGANDGRVF